MRNTLLIGLLLVALLILMTKRILTSLLARRDSKGREQALDKQPDSIRLRRRSFDWQNQVTVHNLVGPLLARSFSEVGDFSIAEMPQLKIRFLVKTANSVYACIYEHPKAGIWLDLVSRYQDGSIITFSTAREPRVEPRPQDIVVNAPELTADMLYTRMLKERPPGVLVSVDARGVVRLFEDMYKDQIDWRKKRGTPASDVASVTAEGAETLESHSV